MNMGVTIWITQPLIDYKLQNTNVNANNNFKIINVKGHTSHLE